MPFLSQMRSDPRLRHSLAPMLVILLLAAALSQSPAQSPRQNDLAPDASRGEQAFASNCAGCHGLDAKGGTRGPNIIDASSTRQSSDSQISQIIANGLRGTGMPAFPSLKNSQITAIISYLRSLQGTGKTASLAGDPTRGKAIFQGKAGCMACHMAAGEGGFAASNLSDYARAHQIAQIRSAIITPASNSKLVTATVRNGGKYVGRVCNEDNFSLQLQTLDGAFQFLSKSDIEGVEPNWQSRMPLDYASRLTPAELDDLVSYLVSVAGGSKPGSPKKYEEWR